MTETRRNMPAIGECVGHLGGRLAPVLYNRLVEMEWIRPKQGRKTVFDVTDKGRRKFKEVFAIDALELDK